MHSKATKNALNYSKGIVTHLFIIYQSPPPKGASRVEAGVVLRWVGTLASSIVVIHRWSKSM